MAKTSKPQKRKINFIDELDKLVETDKQIEENNNSKTSQKKDKKLMKKNTKKKKEVGRPKKNLGSRISIAMPKEYEDKIQIISDLLFNGNKAEFIRTVLIKELKENAHEYETIIKTEKKKEKFTNKYI